MRDRRRIAQATVAAALLSGAPSTLDSLRRHRDISRVATDLRATTRAAGTLLPPGRAGFARGAIVHSGVSFICGQVLARTLPEDHSLRWGAAAGLALGVVNVGVIGRSYPAIRALPLIPQITDNVAFGVIFAAVVDR